MLLLAAFHGENTNLVDKCITYVGRVLSHAVPIKVLLDGELLRRNGLQRLFDELVLLRFFPSCGFLLQHIELYVVVFIF